MTRILGIADIVAAIEIMGKRPTSIIVDEVTLVPPGLNDFLDKYLPIGPLPVETTKQRKSKGDRKRNRSTRWS